MNKKIVKKEEHKLFKVLLIIKIIIGFLELIVGLFLFLVSDLYIKNKLFLIAENGFAHNLNSHFYNYLLYFSSNLSISIQLVLALHLIFHAFVNFGMVVGLIKRIRIVYPVSIFVLIGFIIYQMKIFFLTSALWWLFLSIIDLLFIYLVYIEYKELKRRIKSEIVKF